MIWCLEFEVLQKAYAKSKSILDTEERPTKFLIKSLGELEDFVQTVRVEGGEGVREGGRGGGGRGSSCNSYSCSCGKLSRIYQKLIQKLSKLTVYLFMYMYILFSLPPLSPLPLHSPLLPSPPLSPLPLLPLNSLLSLS